MVKVIENNAESDELQNKASILTFKGSSKGQQSSTSQKQASPAHGRRNSSPKKTERPPISQRAFQTRDASQPKSLMTSSEIVLPQVGLTSNDSNAARPARKFLRTTTGKDFKDQGESSKSPTPRNRKVSSKFESSSNMEAPEVPEDKSPSKLRGSKLILPIDPDTYQKLQKKSAVNKSNYTPFEVKQLEEVKPRPTINKNSENINKRLNRGNYDNVHERLFYKGIEQIKRKEELENIEFSRTHTFRPVTGRGSPKAGLKKEDIDKLVYSYKEREVINSRKKYLLESYDIKDGSKLFIPRINQEPPVKHAYSLEEIEAWKAQAKEYLIRLRQIFDFLDKGFKGYIEVNRIDYENIHPDLLALLKNVIEVVEMYGQPLDFAAFYDLTQAEGLAEEINFIFDTINKQPLINPKPIKTKNFTFTN